jgi:hypothetical protein
MKAKTKAKPPEIEVHPDAWERFEKAVDVVNALAAQASDGEGYWIVRPGTGCAGSNPRDFRKS